jgi:hypothetical protein
MSLSKTALFFLITTFINCQKQSASTHTPAPSDGNESNATKETSPDISLHTDIPGYPSTVTATLEGALNYTWELVLAPIGSNLTTADLENPDKNEVTFMADRSGDYLLMVHIGTELGTLEARTTVTIKGYDIPFIVDSLENDSIRKHVAMVLDSGAGEPRAIGCAYSQESTNTTEVQLDKPHSFNDRYAAIYLPQTLEEHAQVVTLIASNDTQLHGSVEFTHSQRHCDTDPPLLLPGVIAPVFPIPYVFSPDGTRVLITDRAQADKLISVGTQHLDVHVIHTEPHPATHTTQLAWVDNSTVAWTSTDENGKKSVHIAQDITHESNVDASTILIDCANVDDQLFVTPQFVFVGEHIVLLHLNHIYRLDKDPQGAFSCDATAETTHILHETDNPINDFQVSAHNNMVVFSTENGVYLLPVDGSASAAKISPDDGGKPSGAKWALRGRQIVWSSTVTETQTKLVNDETQTYEKPVLTRIYRANANGSNVVAIWEKEATDTTTPVAVLGTSRGSTCAGGSGAFSSTALLMYAELLRRRRIKSKQNTHSKGHL